jgi:hypothetical protein
LISFCCFCCSEQQRMRWFRQSRRHSPIQNETVDTLSIPVNTRVREHEDDEQFFETVRELLFRIFSKSFHCESAFFHYLFNITDLFLFFSG